MSGSSFGTIFRITTWGESHGRGVGVVVDGCPAGLPLQEETIQAFLDRRKPGQSRYTTKRAEADRVEILSGVFEGRTDVYKRQPKDTASTNAVRTEAIFTAFFIYFSPVFYSFIPGYDKIITQQFIQRKPRGGYEFTQKEKARHS